jgi:hypothetical protein
MLFLTFFYLIFFGFFALGIALTAFWIWMIVDCVKNEPSTGNDKIAWLLLLLFTHGLGALIYFFVRRSPRQRLQLPPVPPG